VTVWLIPPDLHSGVKDALADNAPPSGFQPIPGSRQTPGADHHHRDKARIVCSSNNVVCVPRSLCIIGSMLQKAKQNANVAVEMSKP
jgi:hypothetical protein